MFWQRHSQLERLLDARFAQQLPCFVRVIGVDAGGIDIATDIRKIGITITEAASELYVLGMSLCCYCK